MVAAGDPVNASDVNTLNADTIARPLVRLAQSVAQSLANATNVAITFTTEDYDTHGYHDNVTNNTRVTPTLAGYYRAYGTVWLASSAAITSYYVAIGKNGAIQLPLAREKPAATAVSCSTFATGLFFMNGTTDYFELICNQTSGGALNTSVGGGTGSILEVEFLRP